MFYRIPLQWLTGDTGVGMYQAVYSIFSVILILVVSGIPVALSKMISEQVAVDNIDEEKRITGLALRFISVLGLLAFLFLFFASPIIEKWTGMTDVSLAIKSVSFTLLFIPLLAVLRGFFYGHQNLTPAASSQVIEQFFRVVTILFLTILLVKWEFSLEYVIAGATFGTVIGVIFSVIYLGWKYIRTERGRSKSNQSINRKVSTYSVMSQAELFKKIFFSKTPTPPY